VHVGVVTLSCQLMTGSVSVAVSSRVQNLCRQVAVSGCMRSLKYAIGPNSCHLGYTQPAARLVASCATDPDTVAFMQSGRSAERQELILQA
jgi:hypothetical protein